VERPQTIYARSGDVSIAYQSVGEGAQTVIVCPGFVSNVEQCWAEPVFHRLITRAAQLGRVLIFDKRGTGLSDPVVRPPTFDERTDDIRAVLDDAGVDRAALFGISEGGPMAMLFAATHPDRVTHLALYGTFAAGPDTLRDEGDPAGHAWSIDPHRDFADAIEHWGEGRTIGFYAAKVAHRPLERRIWASWERSGASPGVIKHLFESLLRVDVRSVLPSISAPTVVVHFRDDRAVPIAMAEQVASLIPGARFAPLAGGDHVPFNLADMDRAADELEALVTGVRPASRPDRQLVTVVFTDIVASTEKAVALGDSAWVSLVGRHHALVRSLLAEHRGHEVRTMGDGFLATFDGPGRAVAFAHALNAQLQELDITIRVGVHTGECDVTADDIHGLAVHIASRVCDLAEPGEVLVTSTVCDLIAGSNVPLLDRGEHQLKGVPGEWRLAAAGDAVAIVDPVQPNTTVAANRVDRALERLASRYPTLTRASLRAVRTITH
jgi:class 3 adenylate cyclase/pimeloyl-ACP methyl ester carboxylesterase